MSKPTFNVFVQGVSFYTPQIPDWSAFGAICDGAPLPLVPVVEERYQPQRLPRNERRRATNIARLTFRLFDMIHQDYPFDETDVASVFASSGGDYDVVHSINSDLRSAEKISPIDFHNSVHNATAGYWSIACGCHSASTSISNGEHTFAAAILEATLLCMDLNSPVLLMVYDIPPPGLLALAQPSAAPMGCALLLAPTRTNQTLASVQIRPVSAGQISPIPDERFAGVASHNPARACLPFLAGLHAGGGQIDLEGTPDLQLTVVG